MIGQIGDHLSKQFDVKGRGQGVARLTYRNTQTYSITSSARANNVGGKPFATEMLRLLPSQTSPVSSVNQP